MSIKPFKLSETTIQKYCDRKIFERAEEYIDSISTLRMLGDRLIVMVSGSMPEPYRVIISLNEKDWRYGSCTCPTEFHPCKHIVATLLQYAREGLESFKPSLEETLNSLDEKSLRDLLINLVEHRPELFDEILNYLNGSEFEEEGEEDDDDFY